MKYVFFVHSHIVYLTALAVIESEQMNKKDVLILSFDYSCDIQPIKIVQLKEKPIHSWSTFYPEINKCNKLIGNEPFTAYIPAVYFHTQIIITNPNCKQFHFIEEGLSSYSNNENLNSFKSTYWHEDWFYSFSKKGLLSLGRDLLRVIKGYTLKLHTLPLYPSSYMGFKDVLCYGMDSKAYPYCPAERKKILDFKILKNVFDLSNYNNNLSNKFIWLGCDSVTVFDLKKEVYLDGIKVGVIDYLSKLNIKSISIKFHPREIDYMKKQTIELFTKNGFEIDIIKDQVSMELCFLNSKNLSLFGVTSSLLYYGALLGHRCYSVFDVIKGEYEPLMMHKDFSFYWDKVDKEYLK
jgi:hypothetical protein